MNPCIFLKVNDADLVYLWLLIVGKMNIYFCTLGGYQRFLGTYCLHICDTHPSNTVS